MKWDYFCFHFFVCSLIDVNAVKPFMVQMPENAYETNNIDKDIMFGVTSNVC